MLIYMVVTPIIILCGMVFQTESITSYYMLASFFYIYYQIDHGHITLREYLYYMVPLMLVMFVIYIIALQFTQTVQFNTTINALAMQLFFTLSSILLKRQFRM